MRSHQSKRKRRISATDFPEACASTLYPCPASTCQVAVHWRKILSRRSTARNCGCSGTPLSQMGASCGSKGSLVITTVLIPAISKTRGMCSSTDWLSKKARASARLCASVGKPKALSTATTPRVDSEIGVFSINKARQIASACCVLERAKY